MAQRPTVLLLIPHLGGGGAERIAALLARGLSAEKYDIHLGLITDHGADPEPPPQSICVHRLGARRVRGAAFRLLRLVHQLKPDLILSGMAHLNFFVLLLRPLYPRKTRILVRQNATVSAALESASLPAYTGRLYRLLYPRADAIICQTPAMALDLARQSGVRKARLRVLPNPVDGDSIHAVSVAATSPWIGPGPHLLAVGRLAHEKGFDLLLKAFHRLRLQFPTADLVILGAGPEQRALEHLSRALQLESSARFAGQETHPARYFPGASLFALASRHEGMPNALLEAGFGGLPIVAVPSSGGVVDLLLGQPGVWLASEISSDALAVSLVAALRSLKTGDRFPHPWVDPFRLEPALRRYEALIDETLVRTLP